MPVIKGGIYLTVEQYRKLIGYRTTESIYRALRTNRLPGAIKIGNTWIIPQSAVIINHNMKHGLYSGIRKRLKELKN